MYYTLRSHPNARELMSQGGEAIRAAIVGPTLDYMVACGTALEDAAKIVPLLNGGMLTLIKPEIRIASIDRHSMGLPLDPSQPGELDIQYILDALRGKFTVPASGTRRAYDIVMRDGPQSKYVVAVSRKGTAEEGVGVQHFETLSIVIPETEGPNALCLGLDLFNDGKELRVQFSGTMYRPRRADGSGNMVRENRLQNLTGMTNLAQAALETAIAAGFPVFQMRKNRSSREERELLAAGARYGSGASYGHRRSSEESNLRDLVPEADPFQERM